MSYRRDVEDWVRQGGEESRFEILKNRFAIGTEEFAERIRSLVGKPLRECDHKSMLRRKVDLDDITKAISAIRGENWEDMAERRGDWARPLAMWAARQYSGMSLRETGAALGGRDYAAVSMSIRRLESMAKKNRKLRQQQIALERMFNVKT